MNESIMPEAIRKYLESFPKTGREKLADEFGISKQDARMYCRIMKGRKENANDFKKVLAAGDWHIPYQDEASVEIFFEFLADFKPDVLVLPGDFCDFECISKFNKSKWKIKEGKRLSTDYARANKMLDRINEAITWDCEKVFIIGNHEQRVNWAIEESPQEMEGFAELENNLHLDGWKLIPYNGIYTVGSMNFIHGSRYNQTHAKYNAMEYDGQIFSWHVHTSQVFTLKNILEGLPKQGVSVGCMCSRNPSYRENQPNHWVNQFLYAYVFTDGSFTYYSPIIIEGRCVINDKLYGVD